MTVLRDVPADPALPDLATVLDETAMRAILSEAIQAGGGAPLERCTITWIKYKPGKSCTVAWRLLLGDAAASKEQRAYGRAFPRGGSSSRFARTSTARRVPTAAGPAVLHLPGHDMVVWLFPNDRKLHGLDALTDSAMLRDVLLPEVLVGRWGSGWRLTEVAPRVVHFVPEHTCTIRLELTARHDEIGTRSAALYGKTYYNDQGREAAAAMQRLRDRRREDPDMPALAEPWGWQPAHRILWQEEVAGEQLSNDPGRAASDDARLEQVATAVAAVHRVPPGPGKAMQLREVARRLQDAERLVRGGRPDAGDACHSLVKQLLARPPRLSEPLVTMHGDLHLENFLVDGRSLALIDLDTARPGLPWCDLGSLAASLIADGLSRGRPGAAIQHSVEVLCDAYRSRVPWPIDDESLAWFIDAALLYERAARCITRLKPGAWALLDAILAWVGAGQTRARSDGDLVLEGAAAP